ncbi:MAG: glycosyltransferase [Methylococcus sp.]|nr:glycosyltransferase [Methylococcus sp.]
MSPAISVILPCYNHQAYVRQAIDSVLGQTLSNIEIIAIDDCSSDGTAKIIESIDDSRLTLITHDSNQGSANTINEGIAKASAPYIAILNSDDLFLPKRLEICLKAITQQDVLLLGTDLDLIDAEGNLADESYLWWLDWYRGLKAIYASSQDLIGTLIAGNMFISTSNFFFHKSLVDKIGPLADHRYVQDYEFLLRLLAKHPGQVAWLPQTLYKYRLHGSNTILDDPALPAVQTVEILAQWMPELAVGGQAASRLRHFGCHLKTLAGYIETGAAQKVHAIWRTDAEQLHARLAEYERLLDDSRQQLENNRQMLIDGQKRMEQIYASHSYRLGYQLLQPIRSGTRLLKRLY